MKILIISNLFPPDFIGGYELGCCRIAQALAQRGHDVTVVTSRSADGLKPEEVEGVRVHRLFAPVREMLLEGHPAESTALRVERTMRLAGVDHGVMRTLLEIIARLHPEVIYLFNPVGLGPLGVMESILASGVPAVLHLMDNLDLIMTGLLGSGGLLARFAQWKQGFTALACSRGNLERNSRVGRYAAAAVIYSGIEQDFSPDRIELKTEGAGFRFICTGQVTRLKGIPQLLAAFEKARLASPVPLQLHMVGRIGDELASAASRPPAGVVFHGHRTHGEVVEMLRGMDAGVYPLPDSEAFGYAPIECLCAGVPAILPRQAGCSEMLPEGYPLFIASRENVAELAGLMGQTVRDSQLRRRALEDFTGVRQRYSFAEHTLPGIERALRGAGCFRTAPEARKTLAFAESLTTLARTQPGLLLRSP